MEQNFTDITKKIEARRLAIAEALEQETKLIESIPTKLAPAYEKSVKSVLNSLKNNIVEQENELMQDLTKQVKRQNIALYLLPVMLLIGIAIGATLMYTINKL